MSSSEPVLIICFGVSGCGKSTVAQHLATRFDFNFIEADDFHSEENKAHMASGKALSDAMREPWVNALCDFLTEQAGQGRSCIMANSCLRQAHRLRFRNLPFRSVFVHLSGTEQLIHERMQARAGHFMPAALLSSQFAAFESTEGEADVALVDISSDEASVCLAAEGMVKRQLGL
ncbi:MAG: gluconokinase [Alteromonadaceae bacterium]|nr:MAG: gluconokinase [Alteromonadaceae bacterium]